MAPRRLTWAVLTLLAVSVLFWVLTVVTDKTEFISRHMSNLDRVGHAPSRNYDTSQSWKWGKLTSLDRKLACQPQNNVVFIKTHKTASSTTSGIFDHYAYNRNLTVAVPPDRSPYMDRTQLFHRDMVAETPEEADGWRKEDGFNMLTVHARYNRREMDAVVHNAKYVTILRDPGAQFISAFVFFNYLERFGRIFESRGEHYESVIEGFLQNPMDNYNLMKHRPLSQVLWNQQMFDLGIDPANNDDDDVIEETIARLDKELDLVMITEYYDESLLLLREALCWGLDDILYVQRLVRNSSGEVYVSEAGREKIRAWNSADTRLYNHFNKTLWRRIAAYGPSFQRDLNYFRYRLAETPPRMTGKHSRDTKRIIKRMKDRGILVR